MIYSYGDLDKQTLTILQYAYRSQLRILDAIESGLSIPDARQAILEQMESVQQALAELS